MIKSLKKLIQLFLDSVYPIFKVVLPYQVYAYLGVGAINTTLNIILFAVLYQLLLPAPGISVNGFLIASYTISLLIAFLITVPTGFWLSKNFAFATGAGNSTPGRRQMGKYFLVVFQGLVSDYLLLKVLIVYADLHPTIAKIVSTFVVLSCNYLLQKYFTFKTKTVM
jgi:putative flippase GtrA